MAQAYQIDYPEFQTKLVASLRKAWQDIRSKRSQESFYLFGIETDSDITDLQPLCNTEEQYAAEGRAGKSSAEKWFMDDDAKLYRVGNKYTAALSKEVNRYVFEDHTLHSEKFFQERKRQLLKVFEQALVQLDEEGFFGTGKNRNRVLLQIAFVDPSEAEWRNMLKVIKRINPLASTAAFFKALEEQQRTEGVKEANKQHSEKSIKDLAIDFLHRKKRAFDRCLCADPARTETITPFLLKTLGETTPPKELWEVLFEAKNEPEGRSHGPGVLLVYVIPATGKCVIPS